MSAGERFKRFVRKVGFERFNYLTPGRGMRSVQVAGSLSAADKEDQSGIE